MKWCRKSIVFRIEWMYVSVGFFEVWLFISFLVKLGKF